VKKSGNSTSRRSEDLRGRVALVEASIAQYRTTVERLSADITAEEKRYRVTDPASTMYPLYAQVARRRRENLNGSIGLLEQQLESLRRALSQQQEKDLNLPLQLTAALEPSSAVA
jgi:chromosome segregation ATPase